jgi:hypothetical protein
VSDFNPLAVCPLLLERTELSYGDHDRRSQQRVVEYNDHTVEPQRIVFISKRITPTISISVEPEIG